MSDPTPSVDMPVSRTLRCPYRSASGPVIMPTGMLANATRPETCPSSATLVFKSLATKGKKGVRATKLSIHRKHAAPTAMESR